MTALKWYFQNRRSFCNDLIRAQQTLTAEPTVFLYTVSLAAWHSLRIDIYVFSNLMLLWKIKLVNFCENKESLFVCWDKSEARMPP